MQTVSRHTRSSWSKYRPGVTFNTSPVLRRNPSEAAPRRRVVNGLGLNFTWLITYSICTPSRHYTFVARFLDTHNVIINLYVYYYYYYYYNRFRTLPKIIELVTTPLLVASKYNIIKTTHAVLSEINIPLGYVCVSSLRKKIPYLTQLFKLHENIYIYMNIYECIFYLILKNWIILSRFSGNNFNLKIWFYRVIQNWSSDLTKE